MTRALFGIVRRLVLVGLVGLGATAPTFSARAETDTAPERIDNAIYSWWVQPLSVNDGDYTWVGSIAKLGTVRVFKVNRDTGTQQEARLSRIEPDDHNGPAIAFDPSQTKLVVFYSNHNSDEFIRYNTIDRTTLTVGPEQQLNFGAPVSYVQVLQWGAKLVVLSRVADTSWRYLTSNDWGQTWDATPKTLVSDPDNGKVYLLARPVSENDNRVRIATYKHPTSGDDRTVRYALLFMDTGEITIPGGVPIGNFYTDAGGPNLHPDWMSLAIDPSPGYRVRLLDVGTVGGMPAISYAVWYGAEGAATYKVKLYQQGAWTTASGFSEPSGDPFGYNLATHYVGGVAIGRTNNRLYVSREDNGTWYLDRWHFQNNAFVKEKNIRQDTTRLVRPNATYRSGPVDITVQEAPVYDHYTQYDSDLLVY